MRKWFLLLLTLLLPIAALAELPILDPGPCGETVAEHMSDTLWWRIEEVTEEGVVCYLTRICMADPGRQIGKAAAPWRKDTMPTAELAQQEPDASLLINGSGYVTWLYSWIPENYPGRSEDYWYTPLGTVTVTDGEILRNLDLPYYGLSLTADGLQLHVGDDAQQVLAANPTQTWSFYVECPIIKDGVSILDPDWNFTRLPNIRNIVCKLDAHNYLILTVTRKGGGLTMQQCVDYLLEVHQPEWAHNLDGGPSAALMYRDDSGLHTVWAPGQDNVDLMTFGELPAEGE